MILGLILAAQGKAADADTTFREALAVFRGKRSMEDWHALASMGRAAMLLALNRPDEAMPLLTASWSVLESERRVAPWQKRRIAELVAAGYEKAGKPTEAAAWRTKLASDGKK